MRTNTKRKLKFIDIKCMKLICLLFDLYYNITSETRLHNKPKEMTNMSINMFMEVFLI